MSDLDTYPDMDLEMYEAAAINCTMVTPYDSMSYLGDENKVCANNVFRLCQTFLILDDIIWHG